MPFKTSLGAALVALAGFAGGAVAQEAQPEQPQAVQAEFSDEKLQSFVVAALEVSEIQTSYQETVAAAGTPEEQQTLIEQANGEMAQAIEDAPGITIEEYVEIGEATQADTELSSRISAIVAEQAETE